MTSPLQTHVAMTVSEAVAATGGELLQPGAEGFVGLCSDSRQLQPGEAFVALSGERFDAHAFCGQAVQRGASLLLVERAPEPPQPGVAVIKVADTRQALGQLARAWKRRVAPTTVAITGSVGKTTTKELTAAVLRQLGPTHCTPGNFNNDVGLPLTLLSMPPDTRYLVTEMGMNALGEIAALTRLAEPDVGLVTCVAPVHLEGLGSLEAVADAKGELPRGLPQGGWAVTPHGEALLERSLSGIPAERRLTFGHGEGADVRLLQLEARGARGSWLRLELAGEPVALLLPLVGEHNALNAAAAAAVGLALGAPPETIRDALAGMEVERLSHRSRVRTLGPWQLLDDCYNANPVATRAAVDTVVRLAGTQGAVAVLGDMLELGTAAERYHRELGRHVAHSGLQLLVTVGVLARQVGQGALEAGMASEQVVMLASADEAARVVRDRAPAAAWILVKGSRGARLEQVIERLED